MIYKNIEIHNVSELIDNNDGSVSWKRFPSYVHSAMEGRQTESVVYGSTGVELRFVIKGESATVRMSTFANNPKSFSTFHVYRGDIQGGWDDHEVHRHVTGEIQEFVIKRSENIERLREMSSRLGYGFDPEVVRVIFDRGRYKIYDVEGDVAPPAPDQCPQKTLLAYGSSITHGSNSIDASHSWVSVLAHNLNVDARNLGMAGSCMLEPETAEYIASEGEKGKWDIATLEIGINVLGKWDDDKIISRTENLIRQVAGRNKEKPVFVISPFYFCGDDFNEEKHAAGERWREYVRVVTAKLNYSNVTYINGLDVIGDMSYISADEVHPNIYGVQKIADILTERIKSAIKI